jgi:uncharacterized damage-inducible protein DinB
VEIHDVTGFLEYFESVHRRTRAVARCIPAHRLEWSPGPGRFTPGDLVRHIAAAERWMWGENVQGKASRYPGHGEDLARGTDAVLAYLDDMHAETVAIVASLSGARLTEMCRTVGGVDLTVWKWLRLMVEHEIHHRGQLYEVLGLAGVETPPLYGLTEPEVRAASGGSAAAPRREAAP